jgi:hypothetical protein
VRSFTSPSCVYKINHNIMAQYRVKWRWFTCTPTSWAGVRTWENRCTKKIQIKMILNKFSIGIFIEKGNFPMAHAWINTNRLCFFIFWSHLLDLPAPCRPKVPADVFVNSCVCTASLIGWATIPISRQKRDWHTHTIKPQTKLTGGAGSVS